MAHFDVIVVGGGASGYMAAITAARQNPNAKIVILEKSRETLNKVRISGGGRCNVTNQETIPKKFVKHYPRGEKFLMKAFEIFNANDTRQWFENEGVVLKTEPDGRMFPNSNKSETIVNCLQNLARKLNVEVKVSAGVHKIEKANPFQIVTLQNEIFTCNHLVMACGGFPSLNSYGFLQDWGIEIVEPCPSLFTLNTQNKDVTILSGLSVTQATVKLVGGNLATEGPLLITHWGFSGPAILKFSAWGAQILKEKEYNFKIFVNFTPEKKQSEIEKTIDDYKALNQKKVIVSNPLYKIPERLWKWLCEQADIELDLKWLDISNKKRNKLVENLFNCPFEIVGKSTFKEEFVTCGGVALSGVDYATMMSKTVPNLYFTGELLDIDGITGGFNFQAAWTSGYIAGISIKVI